MRYLSGFARFWYDFIIGDDWKIAAAVVLVLAVGGIAVASGGGAWAVLGPLLAVGLALAFCAAVAVDTRSRKDDT